MPALMNQSEIEQTGRWYRRYGSSGPIWLSGTAEELAAADMIHGVEYNYPRNNEDTRKKIQNITWPYNLITTGGTDFHGEYAESPYP